MYSITTEKNGKLSVMMAYLKFNLYQGRSFAADQPSSLLMSGLELLLFYKTAFTENARHESNLLFVLKEIEWRDNIQLFNDNGVLDLDKNLHYSFWDFWDGPLMSY